MERVGICSWRDSPFLYFIRRIRVQLYIDESHFTFYLAILRLSEVFSLWDLNQQMVNQKMAIQSWFYHFYHNFQLLQLLIKLHCVVSWLWKSWTSHTYYYLWIPCHALNVQHQMLLSSQARTLELAIFVTHLYLFHLNANWNKNWMLCTRGNTSEATLLFYRGSLFFRNEKGNIFSILVTHSELVSKYQKYKMSGCWLQIYLKIKFLQNWKHQTVKSWTN